MTKAQKIIIVVAAALVMLSVLFPPYRGHDENDEGEVTEWHIRWELIRELREELTKSQADDSGGEGMFAKIIEIYPGDFEPLIWLLEIFVIAVLAGALLFAVSKKESTDGSGPRWRKAKKTVVLVTASLIIVVVLFPPCAKYSHSIAIDEEKSKTEVIKTGWGWILDAFAFKGKIEVTKTPVKTRTYTYCNPRLGILALEILGILVLAGAALLITKKTKRD